jgi:hypothetical protein
MAPKRRSFPVPGQRPKKSAPDVNGGERGRAEAEYQLAYRNATRTRNWCNAPKQRRLAQPSITASDRPTVTMARTFQPAKGWSSTRRRPRQYRRRVASRAEITAVRGSEAAPLRGSFNIAASAALTAGVREVSPILCPRRSTPLYNDPAAGHSFLALEPGHIFARIAKVLCSPGHFFVA